MSCHSVNGCFVARHNRDSGRSHGEARFPACSLIGGWLIGQWLFWSAHLRCGQVSSQRRKNASCASARLVGVRWKCMSAAAIGYMNADELAGWSAVRVSRGRSPCEMRCCVQNTYFPRLHTSPCRQHRPFYFVHAMPASKPRHVSYGGVHRKAGVLCSRQKLRNAYCPGRMRGRGCAA